MNVLQPISRVLLLSVFCGALTACSSGGGGGSTNNPSSPTGSSGTGSFSEQQRESNALFSEIEGTDPTDPSSLPDSGSYTYRGVMDLTMYGAGEVARDVLSGDLTMNVEFADPERISGSVNHIVNDDNDPYQGSLSLQAGDIDRTANPDPIQTYLVGLNGSVTDPGGAQWNVEGTLRGNFYEPDYSHTAGEVDGVASSPMGNVELNGRYAAER